MVEGERQRVEAVRPQLAEGLQPAVELAERDGAQPVEPAVRVGAHLDEAGVAQHLEVLGHRRLREAQLVDELAHRALAGSQQFEDAASVRLGERGKHRHTAILLAGDALAQARVARVRRATHAGD